MAQQINYTEVEVPSEKSPTEYHYTERRAEILDLVLQVGGPAAINQSTLADRYQVDRSTISRDMDRLSESISSQLGQHIDLTVKASFDKAISELQGKGEYKAAFKAAIQYSEWLADRGVIDSEPLRVEHDGTIETDGEFNINIQHHRVTESNVDSE